MVVDASALIAIMTGEPNSAALAAKILASDSSMSAPSVLEAYMVLTRHFGANTQSQLTSALSRFDITIVPFGPEHAWEAVAAFEKFGKGRHPAGLNFGDCIVYGLAKSTGRPVLFTGNDFSKTDVLVA